jgi:5,10-methylenetetrahydromethanopterin reductase
MKLGAIANWAPGDLQAFRDQARLAEELGYEVFGVGDTPAAWQDMIVSLSVAAAETKGLTFATTATTPFLRHPLALARAMLSIGEIAEDRVVIGFGAGGSGPASVGRKSGTLKEVRDYVVALRALLNGESVEWDGFQTTRLVNARPLRIFLAADGPKQQQAAAEIADGVIINVGMSMDVVDKRIEHIRESARAIGRDPDELEIWGYTYASIRDSRDDAVADIAAFLAIMGAIWMKRPYARALAPPELSGKLDEMLRNYDPTEHVVVGGRMATVVQELGLTDFLAGLCALAGTPAEVRHAAGELEQRGIACVLAALPGQVDPLGTLRRFADAAKPAGG